MKKKLGIFGIDNPGEVNLQETHLLLEVAIDVDILGFQLTQTGIFKE